MSTFLVSIMCGICAGYFRGGRLRNFGALGLPPGFVFVVWLALGLQVALRWIPTQVADLDAGYSFLIATYGVVAAALGLYLATLFRTSSPRGLVVGVALVAAGWLLNFAVIELNRGMPFSGPTGGHTELFLKHVAMSPDTKLRFLGDVIYLTPFHEIVSAGDLVLALGLAVYLYAAMQGSSAGGATPLAAARPNLPTR